MVDEMTTRIVQGTFTQPDGSPAAGLLVSLRLSPNVYSATEHTLTTPLLTATTDEDGVISVDLVVGARYAVQAPGQQAFAIIIPEGVGTLSLESLHASLDTTVPPVDELQIAIQSALDLLEHGNLIGLADDDHVQYYNAARLTAALASYLTTANAATLYATLASLADEIAARLAADAAHLAAADPHTAYYNQVRGDARYALASALNNYLTTANAAALYTTIANLDAEEANRTNADAVLQADINTRALASALANYGQLSAMYGSLYAPGAWYRTNILSVSQTTLTLALGLLYLTPMLVPRGATFDRMRIEVTGMGSADSVVQVGLYAHDVATGRPGNLVATLATHANPVQASHETVIDQTLTPGWYYIGLLATGTTAPTLRANGLPILSILGTSNGQTTSSVGALTQAGQATLPVLPIVGSFATNTPLVDVRVGSLS
jgi:hypothetical protein